MMETENIIHNGKDERTGILKEQRRCGDNKWQNVEYRKKLFQSLSICASFLALGANAAQIGPTLLDLQIITDTDLGKASAFVTSGAAGDLTGTLLCWIIYEKVDPNLLIFLAVLMEGIATMVTPFCFHYGLMVFIRYVTFFSAGILNTCGNALLMGLWGTEGDQMMHFLHFCYAFGGVLSPLYTEPFLAEKDHEYDDVVLSGRNASVMSNLTSAHFGPNTTRSTNSVVQAKASNVKYAFMISSVFTILLSLLLLPFYFMNRRNSLRQEHDGKISQRQLPRPVLIFTLFIICIFFTNYCFVEAGFVAFLMTFLVREYESVSKSQGAFMTAIYWAAFAGGRLLMVFLSKRLSSVQVLLLSVLLMVVTFIGFLVAAEYAIIDALFAFSTLAGLSLSGVYAAAVSWADAEILTVNGTVAGALVFFSTLATLIHPQIFSHLMQDVGNMWFCYILVAGTITLTSLFLTILVYSRSYLNRRFGPMGINEEEEVSIHESFDENSLQMSDIKR